MYALCVSQRYAVIFFREGNVVRGSRLNFMKIKTLFEKSDKLTLVEN